MSAQRKSLEQLVSELPPELEREVTDFVLFLLEKRTKSQRELDSAAEVDNDTLSPGSPALLAKLAREANINTGETDVSTRSREILESKYADYLAERMNNQGNDGK
jgi:uncharacterized protein DUF2281